MKHFFYIFLCFIGSIKAQDSNRDVKYTPPSNSIFNYDSKASEPGSVDDRKNAVKFIATMVARQHIAAFYEREIVKGVTATAGVGIAFGEDHFQKAFLEVFSGLSFEEGKIFADEILENSQYESSSPLLMIGGRVFFGGKSFEGNYFELSYRNQRNTYVLEDQYVLSQRYVSSSKAVDFKMHAFSMGIGMPGIFGKNKHFTHDLFFCMGMKIISYDEIIEKEVMMTTSISPVQILEKSGGRMTAKIVPSISIGYAFGFAF